MVLMLGVGGFGKVTAFVLPKMKRSLFLSLFLELLVGFEAAL